LAHAASTVYLSSAPFNKKKEGGQKKIVKKKLEAKKLQGNDFSV